jgi:ech hydrogenase subunit D
MSEKKFAIQDIQNIAASELLERVRKLKEDGYRLAQACAMNREYGQDLLYSFDKDHILLNLKVKVNEGEEVESITGEYWPAFIYENEMHDLFGIKFLHNALDYNGNFFVTAEPTPWNPKK